MRKKANLALRDRKVTPMRFGPETRACLAYIIQSSHGIVTIAAAVRGIIHRYVELLKIQREAEEAEQHLILSRVDKTGKVIDKERIDLKIY